MSSQVESAFETIRAGDVQSLTELLSVDPALAGERNGTGLSLVLHACYFNRSEMVALILAAKPELDIFDAAALPGMATRGAELLAADRRLAASWSPDGFTPLHLASYFNHEEMARLLLASGADGDAVSTNAMSLRPLHSACAAGALGIVGLLLERGVDVNARQHGGWTALHSAVNRNDLPVVARLLESGADPEIVSDAGKNSFDLAEKLPSDDVLRLLRARLRVV